MTTTTNRFALFWDFTVGAPLRFVLTHGNQTLVTSASAYMNAQFAGQHEVLPSPWNWFLAIGFEWTYLRGLASAGKTESGWLAGLNYSAFAAAIIGGILYCLGIYGAIPSTLEPNNAFWLAVAHVGPIALVSLCAAQVHRAAQDEAARAARHDRETALSTERDRREAEDREARERRDQLFAAEQREAEERLKLTLWAEAQQIKASLKVSAAVSAKTPEDTGAPRLDAKGSEREQQKAAVLKTLTEAPNLTRTALAKAVGISRGHLYTLLAELAAEGRL